MYKGALCAAHPVTRAGAHPFFPSTFKSAHWLRTTWPLLTAQGSSCA